MREWPQVKIRLPPEQHAFVRELATRDASSQNSVIVRAVREMQERAELTSGALAAAEARRRERAAETKARTLEARERTDETSPA